MGEEQMFEAVAVSALLLGWGGITVLFLKCRT